MIRVMLAMGAALMLASSGQAQTWTTAETCTVTPDQIAQSELDPAFAGKLSDRSQDIPNPVGRLWEIQSPTGAVSHLWGTYHSSQGVILDLPPTLQRQLNAARLLAIEADHRHTNRTEFRDAMAYNDWWQNPLLPVVRFPEFGGADPRISDWIDARIIGSGIDPEYAAHLTPGGVFSILLQDPCEDLVAGLIPIQDFFIQSLAHAKGIPTLGLEPKDAFFRVINNPQNRDLAAAMISAYGAYLQPPENMTHRRDSLALYLRGQIGMMMAWDEIYLSDLLGPNGKDAVLQMDAYMLDQRNRDFLETAGPELAIGGVLIAVGAFHLPGEDGLIEQLRRKGFILRRVQVEGEHDELHR